MKKVFIFLSIAILLPLITRIRVLRSMSEKLSQNFNLREFIRTATGLDNIPDVVSIANLRHLVVSVLQPLRTKLQKPIIVSSGYRSRLVNQFIGGVVYSQHTTGEAADISIEGLSNRQIMQALKGLPYDQAIDEEIDGRRWVHVSAKRAGVQRSMALSARLDASGNKVYTLFS